MSNTRDGVYKRAKREGWEYTEKTPDGGGRTARFYHLKSLPEEARAALTARLLEGQPGYNAGRQAARRMELKKRLDERAREVQRQEGMAEAAMLTGKAKKRMDARLQIVKAYQTLQAETGMTQTALLSDFCALYEAGEVDLPPAVYAEIDSFSGRTLRRWTKRLEEAGAGALGGRYGRRSERAYRFRIEEHEEMQALTLALLKETPHARARHVLRRLRARAADPASTFTYDEVPSVRAVQRYLERFRAEHPQLVGHLESPDRWRSKYQAAFGRADAGVEALNQLWEMDSTPGDVVLADGKRHAVIGVIDVFTRRLKLHVARTSSAAGISSLLRRALLDWGIPETVRTDNGKDYRSRRIENTLIGLGIRQDLCPPFKPEKKPFIERAFGTFTRDLVELLEGYTGHDVAERQDLRARKSFAERLMKRSENGEKPAALRLTAEEFQAFCDDWTDSIYLHDTHRSLGRTPFQQVASWKGLVRRIENERALDMLLAPAPGSGGFRTVQKKGLSVDGFRYQAPELAPHIGQRVMVRFDEADAGRVFVYGGPDVDFLCAAECPELTGADRQELAAQARRLQKRRLAEERRELKRLASAAGGSKADAIREIIDHRAEQAAKVHRIPMEEEVAHTTPQLDAAADAAAAAEQLDAEAPLPQENDEATREKIHRLEQADAAREAEREEPRYFTNEYQKWNHLQAIKHQRALTDAEKAWLYDYEISIGMREARSAEGIPDQ